MNSLDLIGPLRCHYELYKTCKVKSRPTAAEAGVKEFFNSEEITKTACLKHLMKEVSFEFLCENVMPYIAKHITLYEFYSKIYC